MTNMRRRGNEVFLGELEVVPDPQLAAQAVPEREALAEDLLLLPVRLGKVLAALQDMARAGAALAHAAAVLQVRKGKLLDAGSHHEVGVVLHLSLVPLATGVDNDLRHLYTKSDSAFALYPQPPVEIHGILVYCIRNGNHFCSVPGDAPMSQALMNPDDFRTALEKAIQGNSANKAPFSIAWASGKLSRAH